MSSHGFSGEWGPGVVMRTTCPWRHCRAIVDVVRHAPSSDHLNETVDTVRPHTVEGPNYWYGACPGSHLLVPYSERGRENLATHDAYFERWSAEREARRSATGAGDLAAESRAIEDAKRRGTLGHLDVPPGLYFPPRPSDVEDAEAEHGNRPTPPGVELHPHGSGRDRNMTSANDTTISLIALSKQTISNAQEDCSAATAVGELVDAKLKTINEHLTAAGQLVAAAAMGSATPPHLIDEAAAMISVASNHIDDAEARLAGVDRAIHDSFQAAHHAVEKLDEFIAQISA